MDIVEEIRKAVAERSAEKVGIPPVKDNANHSFDWATSYPDDEEYE